MTVTATADTVRPARLSSAPVRLRRRVGKRGRLLRLALLGLALFALAALASLHPVHAQTPLQLRLADDLDRPGEGYCIDVLSVGTTARADLPLVAHNCLPERGSADRIAVVENGRIRMPAFDACVTAFGVVRSLPGSPVVLRRCGGQESFLSANELQRFERDAGRLRLAGSDLCLTVGADAAPTFSATHRWRTLTMERCDVAPGERNVWR